MLCDVCSRGSTVSSKPDLREVKGHLLDARYVSLVERAIEHDEDAFWQIYEMKWRDVLYTTRKMLGNESDASDAAQEAFLQAYRNIGSLKHPEAFNSWLYRIVINTCNKTLAKLKIERQHKTPDIAEVETIDDRRQERLPQASLDKKVEDEMLLAAINTLPENQKATVVLHYYNQMSYEEIADSMGISKDGVETRLRRARKSIKKYLTKVEKSDKTSVTALLAAPVLTGVLSREASQLVTPQMGEALKTTLEGAIAFIAAGGSAILAGSGGTGALTASGASGSAVAAGGSTTVSTVGSVAGMSAGAKLAAGAAATILVVGAGAGIAHQINKHEPEPAPAKSAVTPEKESKKPAKETTETITEETAVVEEVAPEAPSAPVAPAPQPAPAPVAPAQPHAINTLADMIGVGNAQTLNSYDHVAQRAATQAFLGSLGMKLASQQFIEGDTYRLYVLEKQDKRLYVIEKDGASEYGISYVFGSKGNPLPESWELVFKY